MAHPLMFRDDDPMLGRLRRLALGFPGAAEKVSHGRPTFYTVKIFAYYGASVRRDGAWLEHGSSVIVYPDDDERQALLDDVRFFVPAYLGAYGWLGLDLGPEPDWGEVAELLDASFRRTAPKRLVAELTAR